MKKLFITAAAAFLLLPITGLAEEKTVGSIDGRNDILIVRDGWKYGLKKTNGSVIAACEYEEILPIEGSMSHFILSLGGKYGVVDEYGTVLLPVKYSYIAPELYGNKLIIQLGGNKISESINTLTIPSNDPYKLHVGAGDSESTHRFLEMKPLEWMPYDRRFAIDGQWGLADIRPNVAMIYPSYSMVSVCPDRRRYLLMGYTFGDTSAYNIYDTEKETFLLSMDKKVQYSSIYLLRGGFFLVNGLLRRFDSPETNVVNSALSYIVDLNEDYVLCQSGKKVVLVNKQSGTSSSVDQNISHYTTNYSTGDFTLKENGSWILFSKGQRYTGIRGDITFMGGYPIEVNGDNATVIVNGKATYRAKTNFFSVGKDRMSITYINNSEQLVTLEYPSVYEKVLMENCSGFQTYYSNLDFATVKKKDKWEDKAGLMDLKTGKMMVPFEHEGVKPLYGEYYVTTGGSNCLRKFDDPDFSMTFSSVCYNDYTHTPFCWISETGEKDSYALYSMEKDSLLTDFDYTGVEMVKYPGRIMMLGHDYIPFIQNSKKGIMDTEGREIFPASFDQLLFVFTEGFCIVGNNKKFGSVNPYTGAILPCVFEDVGRYVHGRCIVKKNGLWGIADTDGDVVLPNRYKSIADYYDNLDWLRKDNFKSGISFGVLDDKTSPATVEWFDRDGKVICKGTASVPLVQTVIPDGLWDY